MREPTRIEDLKGDDFCERPDADGDQRTDEGKLALQTKVDPIDTTRKPDLDIRGFEFTKGGGAEVLKGSLKADNLVQRLDVLKAKGGDTDLLVEGHDRDDAPGAEPKAVADRVTFGVRNFRNLAGLTGYPWEPHDDGVIAAKADPRNGGNYLQLAKNHDDSLVAEGSIPLVKRIQMMPRPCTPERDRTPAPEEFRPGHAPEYKCVRAALGATDQPLGVSVRTRKRSGSKLEALSVEEGRLSSIPGEVAITIAKSDEEDGDLPRCSDGYRDDSEPPLPPSGFVSCRPPLLSLERPTGTRTDARGTPGARGGGRPRGARATSSPTTRCRSRLAYEQPPRDWGTYPANTGEPDQGQPVLGARVKAGSNAETGDTALRLTAKLKLPRFLDLDPITKFDCKTEVEDPTIPRQDCGGDQEKRIGAELNNGYESQDTLFRLVAAEDRHYGNPPAGQPHLGRVAVTVEKLHAESPPTQIVLTGMPKPDDKDPVRQQPTPGATPRSPTGCRRSVTRRRTASWRPRISTPRSTYATTSTR